jgi:hypothetical protein
MSHPMNIESKKKTSPVRLSVLFGYTVKFLFGLVQGCVAALGVGQGGQATHARPGVSAPHYQVNQLINY